MRTPTFGKHNTGIVDGLIVAWDDSVTHAFACRSIMLGCPITGATVMISVGSDDGTLWGALCTVDTSSGSRATEVPPRSDVEYAAEAAASLAVHMMGRMVQSLREMKEEMH